MRTVYIEGARQQRRIGGAIASLITPFRDDSIDRPALVAHAEWQILSGVDGLAVCSLAGEGPVLSEIERLAIIAICAELAAGRLPVIAATGSHCTTKTIGATRQARSAGADAALVAVPYYSKPTQNGIVAHFESIAAALDMPVIVDNRPAHAGIDLTPATVARLGTIDSIVGIADGTGDVARLGSWTPLLPARVGLYTSRDEAALAFTLAGGAGSFSDAANVVPRLTAALQHAAAAGNLTAAHSLQARLRPLWKAIADDGTPAALKQALCLGSGPIGAAVRLPLVAVEPTIAAEIDKALATLLSESGPGLHYQMPTRTPIAETIRL